MALISSVSGTFASPANAGIFSPRFTAMQRETIKQGDWRLDLARNPFSESMACSLRSRNGRAFYRAGAVAFRFKGKWNTSGAAYRLDDGLPRLMRDDLPELIALKAPIDRGGLANSTQGLVWIPFRLLESASTISIAPTHVRAPRHFRFEGLVALRKLAVERGCVPESTFVEP